MATVTRESIGTLHDKLIVKLEKGDYLPSFEKTLKQYAKTANVPGFRKGMVPSGMLRKMYGQSIFNEEVIRAAGKKLEDYMKDEKLSIFAQPMIMPDAARTQLDMNSPADVDFAFEVGLKPEFEIDPIKNKASLTRYKIVVSDRMMDDEVERIRRRYGKVESQTEVTNKEDLIYATYEQCDANGNVAEGTGKIEDTEVLDKMPAKLKEMVMGKKPEDTIVFRPADVCTAEELPKFMKDPLKANPEEGEQHYKLTITKVGLLIPQELGPELYAQVFQNQEVKDEADFREKLKAELGREFERITNERLQNEMYELLVHGTNIHLPVAFLKRWMREGGEKPKSAEAVEHEFGGFEHQLRWQLISDKLMAEQGIEVSVEEVNKDIKTRVLQYFGLGPDQEDEAPWMDGYMAKIAKDEKMIDETYRRLLYNKLFSYLETTLNITEKEIGEEEFFKLGSAHDAHHHHH
ncbi:MAG: tig [Flavipsychrobacter sp.]|jgi:trigger factor|nr:tig [Flavipsychrobacter sp.]